MTELRPNWLSYLMSGFFAIFVSWALSGCRFGNQVDRPATQSPSVVLDLYETEPASFRFCATTTAGMQCGNMPTDRIGGDIGEVMGNPVGLYIHDPSAQLAFLVHPVTRRAIEVYATQEGSLGYVGENSPVALMSDLSCTRTFSYEINGTVTKYDSPRLNSGGQTVLGRMDVGFLLSHLIQGACDNTLELMRRCYEDEAQCGGAIQSENERRYDEMQSLFSSYIEAGAMTVADIEAIRALQVEIQYQ